MKKGSKKARKYYRRTKREIIRYDIKTTNSNIQLKGHTKEESDKMISIAHVAAKQFGLSTNEVMSAAFGVLMRA